MTLIVDKILAAVIEASTNPNANLRPSFEALKSRPLMSRDFEKAKAAMRVISSIIPEMLFRVIDDTSERHTNQHPRERRLSFFYSFLAPYIGEAKDNNAIVSTDRISVTWRDCFRCIRTLPLNVDMTNLGFDYIRQTSHPMRFDSDDVIYAAMFSLPLSKAISPYLEDKKAVIPVAIPHSRGLFVGSACKTFPNNAESVNIAWKASRNSTRGVFKETEDMGDNHKLDTVISINRFIGFQDFTPSHSDCYEALNLLREDAKIIEGLQCGLDIYSWGGMHSDKISPQDHRRWGHASQQVTETVESLIAQTNNGLMRILARGRSPNDGSRLFALAECIM